MSPFKNPKLTSYLSTHEILNNLYFLNSILESHLTTLMQACSKLHLAENIAQKNPALRG